MKSVFSILCLLRCFWEILLRWRFSSSVNICGTYRADFPVLFSFSVRIWYALPTEIPISYDTSSTVICRSSSISFCTLSTTVCVVDERGRPERGISSTEALRLPWNVLPSALLLKCQGNVLHRQLGQSLDEYQSQPYWAEHWIWSLSLSALCQIAELFAQARRPYYML